MQSWPRVSERRTQIYLPEDIYTAVKKEARKEGVSMAQVIRKSLEDNILKLNDKSKINKKRNKAWQDLMSLSGIIKGEPKDFSSEINKYIGKMYRAKR